MPFSPNSISAYYRTRVERFFTPRVKRICITGITLILFAMILNRVDIRSVIEVLTRTKVWYLMVNSFITLLFPIIGARRWQLFLNTLNHDIPYWRSFQLIMGTVPVSTITPSKSGEFLRAYYLKKDIPVSRTISSVAGEKIFDVLSLCILALIGSIYLKETTIFMGSGVLGVIIYLLLKYPIAQLNLPISENLSAKIISFHNTLRSTTTQNRVFLKLVLYSTIIRGLCIFQTFLCFLAFGVHTPILAIATYLPVSIVVGLLPITLAGMGTRDASIIYLFSAYSNPSESLSVGILYSVFSYWLLALVGIPFMKKMMGSQ